MPIQNKPGAYAPDPGDDPYASGDYVPNGQKPRNGNPGGMSDADYASWVAKEHAYQASLKGQVSVGSDPLTINPDNYNVPGADGAAGYRNNADLVGNRQGVQIDQRASDAALQQALQSRGRQQEAAFMQGGAALGLAPSAAAGQAQMALDSQAQQAARAAAMGGGARAIGASTGAFGASIGQGAMGRQGETQQAFQGLGRTVTGMRGGDILSMRQSQDAAFAQAQLEAQQRARNDALARSYLGESNSLGIEQLGADQAYEAQKNSNLLGNAANQQRQYEADQAQKSKVAGATLGVAGTFTGGLLKTGWATGATGGDQ